MQYKLITGPDDSSFCARVSQFLKDGWKLHGSPTMTFDGEKVIVGQAIVRENAVDIEVCELT